MTTFELDGEQCSFEPSGSVTDSIVVTTPWGKSGPIKVGGVPALTLARMEAATLKRKARAGIG